MRVLLLGGTGFLGRATERALRTAGHLVVTAARSAAADLQLDVDGGVELVQHLAANSYDAVVNLLGAGLAVGTADPDMMRRVNSELPPALVTAVAALPAPPHLVHAASSTERLAGQTVDESAYSRSKHEGTVSLTKAALATGTPVTVLRIHNTYGPAQPSERFVAAITGELRAGRPVVLNFPDRVRDFVFVSDVAASIRHAVEHAPTSLTTAEAGSGIGLTLREASLVIAGELGSDADLVMAAEHQPVDPNPRTVCPVLFGTYGLCTTEFTEGIRRTLGSN